MIKAQPSDYQPPKSRLNSIYRGVVEDRDDPLEAGRCRVRVFGVHTVVLTKTTIGGIPTNELPWAQPALPIIEGAISGYGLWGVPLQGSHVFVFFENGNHMQPRYFAAVPGIPASGPDTHQGFNDPDGEYPDTTGQPDWPSDSYPNLVRLKTHAGHILEFDNTPGAETLTIYHSGGTQIVIDASGNMNITVTGDKTDAISGALAINVTGTANITADTVNIDGGGGFIDGVITGESICHFTGNRHADKSLTVECSK